MRKRLAKIVVAIIIILALLSGCYVIISEENDAHYQYTVKVEMVNENGMPSESVNYDELSEQEQEMLFEAFKESDSFLDGEKEYLRYDEPVEVTTGEWKVVRVKGVPILMAIQGPEKRTNAGEQGLDGLAIIVGAFLFLALLIQVAKAALILTGEI